jgi:hypothetical protein
MTATDKCRVALLAATATVTIAAIGVFAEKHAPPASGESLPPENDRVICWIADGEGMQPTGDLERFLADRLGATGARVVTDPEVAHAIMRILGLQHSSVFDPGAAHRLAGAAQARWVLWVKIVSRDVQSKKLLSVPYLFNHRRFDAHVFFDVRLYDANLRLLLGSKRLKLSDRGEGTWQVTEDERLDPAYNNDPVEIHQRYRGLDWRAAALISGYCADLLRPEGLALLEEEAVQKRAAAVRKSTTASPAVQVTAQPD